MKSFFNLIGVTKILWLLNKLRIFKTATQNKNKTVKLSSK